MQCYSLFYVGYSVKSRRPGLEVSENTDWKSRRIYFYRLDTLDDSVI